MQTSNQAVKSLNQKNLGMYDVRMSHQFNANVAIVYQYLEYHSQNSKNGWWYQSIKKMSRYLGLTYRQTSYALLTLENEKLIEKQNRNFFKYNRTLSYRTTDAPIKQNCSMESLTVSNVLFNKKNNTNNYDLSIFKENPCSNFIFKKLGKEIICGLIAIHQDAKFIRDCLIEAYSYYKEKGKLKGHWYSKIQTWIKNAKNKALGKPNNDIIKHPQLIIEERRKEVDSETFNGLSPGQMRQIWESEGLLLT